MEKYPMTPQGKAVLEAELDHIKKVKRPENVKAIEEALEHGDLKENAEYHAAKEQQALIVGRKDHIEHLLSKSEIIDPATLSGDRVVFGAKVTIENVDNEQENIYRIVGDEEASIDNGTISITSPIARALIGKYVGDETVINAPGGKRTVEIVDVEF